ncbi:GerAB/ArcD/ProY family transporter [Virgibacillus necropolis]|uniref:Spore gernimation protein n=1 Tax=Virgibacillus necropolis TaxID=163877 RepID=A0A221MHA9_9BACI|nr:endospore germination permease [Virgibacillus necropolis]ASN07025.1 spore gernimation protein [Virgibacillus necropolis]
MKSFEYGDEKIGDREIMIAVPSMVIGVGILTLPRDLAAATTASDGWIAIIGGGLFAVLVTWLLAKLAVGFPNQSFFTYTSTILSKPVAIVISFLFAVVWLGVTAFEVRRIADVSQHYLFSRTPVEVVSLAFLLVVVYAVSGSRAGLFRLNMMFLPLILLIALVVFIFSLGWFDPNRLLPMFETDLQGYLKGGHSGVVSYLGGFSIVLFYMGLVENPKKAPEMAAIGMCIPIVLYLMLFVLCIGVFGHMVTSNLIYPTIELAKGVEIPGGFFERFESVFFVIWIMAIFNTTAMALDIAVLALNSIFKNIKKVNVIFIVTPIVYLVSMLPQDVIEVSLFGSIISNTIFIYTLFIALVLFVIAKLRGVKRVGK